MIINNITFKTNLISIMIIKNRKIKTMMIS